MSLLLVRGQPHSGGSLRPYRQYNNFQYSKFADQAWWFTRSMLVSYSFWLGFTAQRLQRLAIVRGADRWFGEIIDGIDPGGRRSYDALRRLL
ncbi:hypothetical protein Q31b_12220 [Novipirellula aureliae]|uniref:Uncharacterized protein n=1 Tax=Novipirellula aureliae TaxID=2527966 RepID=A0A5C6EC76_9BACT|nr:hypothetical protein [Novipirellula aureliae]TWU46044.1 hypothetical protein Q31b_12220 [Novipirellula aureliae]